MARSTHGLHRWVDRPCAMCGTKFRIRNDHSRRFCSEKCRDRHRFDQKPREVEPSPAEVDRILEDAVRMEIAMPWERLKDCS